MRQALSVWGDQEERSRLTREALADVDAGHIIDHQAVQAWADSLNSDTADGGAALMELKWASKALSDLDNALSLEIDRSRVDSYLSDTPAISHDRAHAWLTDLAAGNRTECPRW